jgi:hypothetical protein
LALLALAACSHFYTALVPAPVSLLSVERVPARFLGPALAGVLVMSVARCDAWWRGRGACDRLTAAVALVILLLQVAYHSWTVSPVGRGRFAASLAQLVVHVVPVGDRWYPAALTTGLLVSCVAAWLIVTGSRPWVTVRAARDYAAEYSERLEQ